MFGNLGAGKQDGEIVRQLIKYTTAHCANMPDTLQAYPKTAHAHFFGERRVSQSARLEEVVEAEYDHAFKLATRNVSESGSLRVI